MSRCKSVVQDSTVSSSKQPPFLCREIKIKDCPYIDFWCPYCIPWIVEQIDTIALHVTDNSANVDPCYCLCTCGHHCFRGNWEDVSCYRDNNYAFPVAEWQTKCVYRVFFKDNDFMYSMLQTLKDSEEICDCYLVIPNFVFNHE